MKRFSRGVAIGLLATFFTFGSVFGLSLWKREVVFGWLLSPVEGLLSPHDGLPINTEVTEVFGSSVTISWWAGVIAAFPVALVSIFYLIRPSLSHGRQVRVAVGTLVVTLFFLSGVTFAYFVVLPIGTAWLIRFGEGIAVPHIRISNYTGLAIRMLLFTGLVFMLPPAMYVAAKTRLITYPRFQRLRWQYPFMFSLIFGMLITPSFDIPNMLLVAIPIYALWRAGLVLAWLAIPGHEALLVRRVQSAYYLTFVLSTLYLLSEVLMYMIVEYVRLPR